MKETGTVQLEKERNGVPVAKLGETIEAIKQNPALAEFQFRVKNTWINGSHNRSVIKGFYGAEKEDDTRANEFVFDNDEPRILLGEDRGANPVEYLLHALAGCMTTTMVYHAAAQGILIEELESEVEGDLDLRGLLKIDDQVRCGYRNIRVRFKVKSDAPAEVLQELTKYSPTFDVVTNPVAVDVSVEKK